MLLCNYSYAVIKGSIKRCWIGAFRITGLNPNPDLTWLLSENSGEFPQYFSDRFLFMDDLHAEITFTLNGNHRQGEGKVIARRIFQVGIFLLCQERNC